MLLCLLEKHWDWLLATRTTQQLIQAHFFFCDIVGLSDPTMTTRDQLRRLSFLFDTIAKCPAFKAVSRKSRLIFPTGDGVAIGFREGPQRPLELAIQLHQRLRRYNRGRLESESVHVRVGIH